MTTPKPLRDKGSRPGQKGASKDRPQNAPRARAGRRTVDTTEFRSWIDSQGFPVVPSIKVNGPNHPTAVIAVDFGSPVVPLRLSNDQVENIAYWLKDLTQLIYATQVNVRVSHDGSNGVFWASVNT
jgi:hypothetical protein